MHILFLYTIILIVTLIGYLKIAPSFNLVDYPNSRSSHQNPTVRGGGIVFPLAWLLWFFESDNKLYWVTLGVIIVAVSGFLDDKYNLPYTTRLSAQSLAFVFLAIEMNWHLSINVMYWLPLIVVGVGMVNAFNFMDGINGITGLYALSVLLPIQFFLVGNDLNGPIPFLIASIFVFGWFNFTSYARCFSGDVGSTTLGFILVFFLNELILKQLVHFPLFIFPRFSPDWCSLSYFLIFALYGIDTVLTILQRLILKENIFKAHRKHLFQLLVNECKYSHLAIASIYAFIQMSINIWIFKSQPTILLTLGLLCFMILIYIMLKYFLLKKIDGQNKLLTSH
jgi:UDP-N-acetylmuramyl pentapeptide phosphotransferase/UDP-N-acetylglucosamine-1-phosphate transferase